MDALTPESELRLRAELEQQIASLKAALENMKAESERWRTIAERRALPDRRTESCLTPGGGAGMVVEADGVTSTIRAPRTFHL